MNISKTSPAANADPEPIVTPPQGDHTTQPTIGVPTPTHPTSAGSNIPLNGHISIEAQGGTAVEGPDFRSGQSACEDQKCTAAADQTPPTPATVVTCPKDQPPGLADHTPADPTRDSSEPTGITSGLLDPLLALAADVVDDLETVRIANENRYRQLTRDEEDADGEERGFGLDDSHPDVARLKALVDMLGDAEHKAVLNLQRSMRQHALGPWVKAQKGVGEKQAARLLAAIGDPYWNDLHNRPRTVSELWAYCGLHVLRTSDHACVGSQKPAVAGSTQPPARQLQNGTHGVDAGEASTGSNPGQGDSEHHTIPAGVAPKRQRGQKANWSTTAKTRVYLIAASCIKNAASPYRKVYDEGRAKYADAMHPTACVRCGPSGKPAPVGSPLSAGHQHARAMRLVMKAILRDLWVEAKRLHEAS